MATKRPQYLYNEKQLRDEAAAEVAQQQGINNESNTQNTGVRKRKALNPDEKLQQSRNRNREHAKNTRLRKKAYVLKLKALVERISRQKEVEEAERRALGVRIYETHNIRKQVVHTYFNYRAANERNHSKWADILDETFLLVIPITPYRSFHKGDIVNNTRVVRGIHGAISESASLSLLAQSVGLGSPKWINAIKHGNGCYMVHKYRHEDVVISGDQFICHFSIQIEDAEQIGKQCPRPPLKVLLYVSLTLL